MASDDTTLLKYLIGVLNSKVILKYLDWISAKLDETGWRWFKQYVEIFPIPCAPAILQTKVAQLVDQILTAKNDNPVANTSNVEMAIDNLVYRLYGLSKEETTVLTTGMA